MSVSVDDTGKQLPENDAETRATDAVRELKRGASCKDVLATLWPSDVVDEASLAAFARLLRNDAVLARCPPKPSYLRQILAKTVSRATDAGLSDDALCEELAQAVVRDDDTDAASHVALGNVVMRTVDRANEVGLRLWPAAEVLVEWALDALTPSSVLELGAGLGLVGLALARRPGFRVTLTDGDARVCANLRYNAALNDLDEDVVKQFRWEEDFGELWAAAGPFDVVLAADCVYDPALAPPFAAVVDQALKRGADVVLANAVRNPETWRVVVEALAARDLIFEDLACVQVPRLVPARAWAGHAAALAAGALRLGRVVRRV